MNQTDSISVSSEEPHMLTTDSSDTTVTTSTTTSTTSITTTTNRFNRVIKIPKRYRQEDSILSHCRYSHSRSAASFLHSSDSHLNKTTDIHSPHSSSSPSPSSSSSSSPFISSRSKSKTTCKTPPTTTSKTVLNSQSKSRNGKKLCHSVPFTRKKNQKNQHVYSRYFIPTTIISPLPCFHTFNSPLTSHPIHDSKDQQETASETNEDIEKKLAKRIKGRVWTMVKQTLNLHETTEQLLGCSLHEFRTHIESTWEKGMTWDNHGMWHIDHIIPLSSFNICDPLQRLKAFHFSNTRAIWAHVNLEKSDKLYIK